MADFKTHVTFSSAIGAGYAVVASGVGYDLSTSLVAGGLCGVSGMLPDVDSDSGVPRRESLGFAAAIVPMLLIDRFKQFDLGHDEMILLGAGLYFGIRFLAANLIGRWSVHRGMWHSIPAVLIFAGLAFLISGSENVFDRYLKAAAVGLGSFSHLLLDEIYSVDTRGVVPRFKKSFGSAIKFWGKSPTANFSTYAKLAAVGAAILMEPMVVERLELRNPEFAEKVRGARERIAALPRPGVLDAVNDQALPPAPQRTDGPTRDVMALREATPPAEPPASTRPIPQRGTPPASGQAAPWRPTAPGQRPSPWFAPPGQGGGGFAPNRG